MCPCTKIESEASSNGMLNKLISSKLGFCIFIGSTLSIGFSLVENITENNIFF